MANNIGCTAINMLSTANNIASTAINMPRIANNIWPKRYGYS